MIGFFSLSKDNSEFVKKDALYFVSIPDSLPPQVIHDRFAHIAQAFANQMDVNKVYLNYGKDESIEYEY